ncbi:hypothetical protein FB382_001509 [Nocardioides ginsengisegetis]|uniref:Bifunctional DNA primase/polymerase, N-terminal n=1 Tax=Nocardioides ginsengisegetis TaxID=661491 RepID=A0A7W3P964_9ACTN|nr:bifunctional DNA primase/polymerase [Nocardioides ginsengisegetis]MBA8803218.1 hypothetical protein [Nocardioides ginsengisegetis]
MTHPTQPPPHWSTSTMLRVSSEADLRTAALRYARLGIPVFPCVPGGKVPLTPSGFHDASSSEPVVDSWWQRTPDANIGLPTGTVSGVLVVDVDVHPGGSGFEAFERAGSAGLASAWGWLVRTPSGGLHAYYPPSGHREQRSWHVPGAHVDFRGDGGYVVVPPSRIPIDGRGATYTVIAVAQHQPRPIDGAGLRQFLEPPRPLAPNTSLPRVGSRPDKLSAWVASRPEGARNHGLFWAACRMVESGHELGTTLAVLGDAARSSGLPQREAETTIRSAYRIASRLSPASSPHPTRAAEQVIGL